MLNSLFRRVLNKNSMQFSWSLFYLVKIKQKTKQISIFWKGYVILWAQLYIYSVYIQYIYIYIYINFLTTWVNMWGNSFDLILSVTQFKFLSICDSKVPINIQICSCICCVAMSWPLCSNKYRNILTSESW